MKDILDLVVIGAGPSGLFSVFEAGMLGIKSHVFDILGEVGGQCSTLYPNKPIYDVAGHPEIKAIDLIKNLEKQAAPFNPKFHFFEEVLDLKKQSDGTLSLKTSKNNTFIAKSVIIACGMGSFEYRKPSIKNLNKFEDTGHIRYSIIDPEEFRGKRVVIAGGGNSAVDWALILKNIAKETTIIHRGNLDDFRASKNNIEKLQKAKRDKEIDIIENFEIQSLDGDDELESINITSTKNNNDKKTIKTDRLAIFFGLRTNLDSIKNWNLELNEKSLILVNKATMETNIEGVFAVGDIAYYMNKHRLITVEFAEAVAAVYSVDKIINSNSRSVRPHSTSIGKEKGLGNNKKMTNKKGK